MVYFEHLTKPKPKGLSNNANGCPIMDTHSHRNRGKVSSENLVKPQKGLPTSLPLHNCNKINSLHRKKNLQKVGVVVRVNPLELSMNREKVRSGCKRLTHCAAIFWTQPSLNQYFIEVSIPWRKVRFVAHCSCHENPSVNTAGKTLYYQSVQRTVPR